MQFLSLLNMIYRTDMCIRLGVQQFSQYRRIKEKNEKLPYSLVVSGVVVVSAGSPGALKTVVQTKVRIVLGLG